MAVLNSEGNVVESCPDCNGATSTFEWRREHKTPYGIFFTTFRSGTREHYREYRLFRCAGCGRGGLGKIERGVGSEYPTGNPSLIHFFPSGLASLRLPSATPRGILAEFREAETCLKNQCYRAAAGLFRSVLDKVMRANGFKTKAEHSLAAQIDAACADGILTEARKRRAHDEVRVLGNDVLHDDWEEITSEAVELSRHYCQRVLEDFYDDRQSVEKQLVAKGRLPSPSATP